MSEKEGILNNLYDYIKSNMDGWHGDFTAAVTDLSEREEGALLMSIWKKGSGKSVDFIMYADGRMEKQN